MTLRMLTLVAFMALAAAPLTADPKWGQPKESTSELKAKMEAVARGFHGVLGYSLHFRGKPEVRISNLGDEPFPTASTVKTAVMCEALHQVEQGKLKWTDPITVQSTTESREEGGPAYFFRDGAAMPLPEWLHLMITMSDNTATIRLRDLLGMGPINTWLSDHGFKQTKILNGRETDALGLRTLQQQWGLGMTTPNEMGRLFELIRDNQAGSPASCDRMLRILSHQYWDDGIASQVPPDVRTASKSGALDETRSDVCLVFAPAGEYVLAVYTKDQKDQRWTADNEGTQAIRRLSSLVWKHFHPKHPWQPPTGAERLGP